MDHDMLGESYLLGVSSGSPPRHCARSCTAGRSSGSQHRPRNLQNMKEGSVPRQNVSLLLGGQRRPNDFRDVSFYRRTLCCSGMLSCVTVWLCDCVLEMCRSRFHQIPGQVCWVLYCKPCLWFSVGEVSRVLINRFKVQLWDRTVRSKV